MIISLPENLDGDTRSLLDRFLLKKVTLIPSYIERRLSHLYTCTTRTYITGRTNTRQSCVDTSSGHSAESTNLLTRMEKRLIVRSELRSMHKPLRFRISSENYANLPDSEIYYSLVRV